ncbi:MAG TPA: glycosyltransferase [Planctomycetes bacterium]|nr:glycosyltransferase [Planctomycetota bacterium]
MGHSPPGRSRPRVTVVIPSWNGRGLLESCLEALEAAYQRTGLPDAVLVVDNGSEDGTMEWLRDLGKPRVSCLPLARNHGFAFACNRGVEAAESEWILILNNDTIPAPRMVQKLMEAEEREGNAAVPLLCAPVANYVKGKQLIPLLAGEDENSVSAIEARLADCAEGMVEDVRELSGLCLLLRRKHYLDLGGFDERFGLGNFEDDDLCFRFRRMGGRLLIVRDSYVHHLGNRTFIALGMDYEKDLEEKRQVFLKKWERDPLFLLEKHSLEWEASQFLPSLERAQLPSDQTPWLRRLQAKTYGALDQPQRALLAWREYLGHCPKDTEARSTEALLLFQMGRSLEARKTLSRTLDECWFGPVFAASLLTQVARQLHHEAPGEAEDYLRYALDIRPDFVPGLNLKAVWAIEQGRFQEAEHILQPFRQKEDPDLWNNLGIALYQQGKAPEALEAFSEAARRGGPQSPAARNLEALLTTGKQPPERP